MPTWDWTTPFRVLIANTLDKVTAGEVKRLIINLPPRHGKTEMVSVRYPAYRLTRKPDERVILAAYNQTLAELFSRKVRKIAGSTVALSPDKTAAYDWETAAGGGLRAVGVGSGITGYGANLIIIDDPIKSRQEAESQTYRERLWDWYQSDIYSRLEPGAAIIIVMTRWHEDDITGRILASPDKDAWTVIRLPALAEEDDPLGRNPGEALDPRRYSAEILLKTEQVMGSYVFAGLYQQRPAPVEGARFKAHWFRYFEIDEANPDLFILYQPDARIKVVKRESCNIFQTLDPSITAKETSDYFCLATWAVTPEAELLLLDVFREKVETTSHIDVVTMCARRWEPQVICAEKATIGHAIIAKMLEVGLPVIAVKAEGDKISRSLPMQARYEAGTVYHRRGAPFLAAIEDELLHFPAGRYDDFVDCASYAGIHVSRFLPEVEIEDEEEYTQTEEVWTGAEGRANPYY